MKGLNKYIFGFNLIIVLIIANVALSFFPSLKIDLTKDRIHSLSATSKEIVKDLDDIVNIKVIKSDDLPIQAKPAADKLRALLDEFQRINKSKIFVTYADPNKDENAKKLVSSLGIQSFQVSSYNNDKLEVQNAFLSVVLVYGQKQEVLEFDLQNMEYILISGIKKIMSDKRNVVALYEDKIMGEKTELEYLYKFLDRNYQIIPVDIYAKDPLPEAETLVIVGLTKKLDEKTLTKLKDWVSQKKGLIAFIDKIYVNENMQSQLIPKTGIEEIFNNAGMELEEKIVLDESNSIVTFRTQNGIVPVQYPFWPVIRPENVNIKLPVMSGIDSLTLPWASPIVLSNKAIPLFLTTNRAESSDNFSDLSPLTKMGNSQKDQFVLGAMNSDEVKIALVGDADFIKDSHVIGNDRNIYFATNLIDYFSSDASLMSIRAKSLRISPLNTIDEGDKLLTKIANILIPIFILTVIGLLVMIFRKKYNNENYES
jgi:ABC-type uncharacterized transport system involved in gliding motility auxiliary subunit